MKTWSLAKVPESTGFLFVCFVFNSTNFLQKIAFSKVWSCICIVLAGILLIPV